MHHSMMILCFLVYATVACAGWNEEEAKINYLFDEISKVEGVFIRNNTEHTPDKAVAHLQMKLENAMNSWFAPAKDKWTAEMFIEKVASRSSITGKPYIIRFKNGQSVDAGDWLYDRLKYFKHSK